MFIKDLKQCEELTAETIRSSENFCILQKPI